MRGTVKENFYKIIEEDVFVLKNIVNEFKFFSIISIIYYESVGFRIDLFT